MEKPAQSLTRRSALAMALAAALPARADDGGLNLRGRFLQSGYAVGQAAPGADIVVDGVSRGPASSAGWFYVGFDRDAPAASTIASGGRSATLAITPQTYDIQRVDGLPQQTVTPTDPQVLKRIEHDTALKNAAFASRADIDAFKGGFTWPLDKFVVSGHFGNQRVLNGTPKSPHMGFDMAASQGTPIHAPQDGLVVLAEPDLFFEGGLVLIDHGQGLISMYLHQSKVVAKKGQMIRQGQLIGEVGMKGRATGPHLCWRLKWLDRHMDPSLMVA
ncbi:MAG TPA: M23 family metallopeptidase [Asticcacaulis sp.]|nr:M23 family metallopeptidase [Asticcacaulis sp.]